jgi:4-hydroxythreonine-4-phosphate dehydrogenase
LVRVLPLDKGAICFKKIDSTLRGHIVPELKAVMGVGGYGYAVIAPALPAQGRTIIHGTLHVRDCTASWTLDAREMLHREGIKDVALLAGIGEESPEQIAQRIRSLRAAGTQFILCDSASEQELQRIARALGTLPDKPLWVGSAGLARYAAEVLAAARGTRAWPSQRKSIRPNAGPVLFCIGSDHPVTQLQVRRLTERGAVEVLKADLATPDQVRQVLQRGHHLVLIMDSSLFDPSRFRLLVGEGMKTGMGGIVFTGGDTAESLCRAAASNAILLQGEILEGIPWGILRDGLLDGLPVATKSGGFGSESALVEVASFLTAV